MATDPLTQARDAFLQGLQALNSGDPAGAEALFARALALAPGRISVMQNLGITRVMLGRHAEAEALLLAAVDAEPQELGAWRALAQAQMELGRIEAACLSVERCLALGEDSAAMRARHGQCLARLGHRAEAVLAYEAAVLKDPGLSAALVELGNLHREAGQHTQAAACFQRALASGGNPELITYLLAAVSEPRDGEVVPPSTSYVRQLFDEYAEEFDHHLVGQLAYQGHRLLFERLPPQAGPRYARVLDLGCGTGLCGLHVRHHAGRLVGVDLSPAMVEKARQRGIYDALHVADVHAYLSSCQEAFDLVLAADVFIYVGELEGVLQGLTGCMPVGSWLAFTVEAAPPQGPGVQLLPSLRYAHSSTYLQDLAARHGYTVEAMLDDTIRHDQQRPVPGRYVYLQRR